MTGATIWSRAPGGWQVRDTGHLCFYLPGDGPLDAMVREEGGWWKWEVIDPNGEVRASGANYPNAEDAAVDACEWIEEAQRLAEATEADAGKAAIR